MLFPVFAGRSVEYFGVIFVAVFVLHPMIEMPAPTSGLEFTVVVQDNEWFEENFTRLTSTVRGTFRW